MTTTFGRSTGLRRGLGHGHRHEVAPIDVRRRQTPRRQSAPTGRRPQLHPAPPSTKLPVRSASVKRRVSLERLQRRLDAGQHTESASTASASASGRAAQIRVPQRRHPLRGRISTPRTLETRRPRWPGRSAPQPARRRAQLADAEEPRMRGSCPRMPAPNEWSSVPSMSNSTSKIGVGRHDRSPRATARTANRQVGR